jgi:hypothetical protein
VTDTLSLIRRAGYRVNNLFERDDGTWQANLRGPSGGTDFATGATPCAALRACAEKLGMPPMRPAIPLVERMDLL